MRTFAVGFIAIALLAAACASPTLVDADSSREEGLPVSTSSVTTSPVPTSTATTSPVTTSPATTSTATTSPVTTSPATTSPVTTSPATTSGVAPSDESVAPSEDQDDDTEPAEQEPTVTTQPPKETSVKPILPVEPVEPHPSGPVAAAIADLASRLGVDESSVTVVSAEAVVWPDGSLGCPQPGMAYTQVQVDGALIVLSADGRTYDYHTGGGRDPFLCEKSISVDPGGSIGSGGGGDS